MKKIFWIAGIILLTGFYASAQTSESNVNDPLVKENVAPQPVHNCSGHHSETAKTETSTGDATVTEISSTHLQEGNTELKSCSGSKGKPCCQHQSKTEMLKTSTQEAPNSGQNVSTDTTAPQE